MTSFQPPGLYTPVKYTHAHERDPKVLNLVEIAVLRRTANRERMIDIAQALGLNKDYPRSVRLRLRTVFGVDTDEELLAHPDIIRQIKEED